MEDELENFTLTPVEPTKDNQEPDECPFCGSDNLTYGMPEYLDGGVCGPVSCEDCDEDWDQIYRFEKLVF
jgi:hypothetical protein